MKKPLPFASTGCCGPSRRVFLADAGMGFTGLALGSMMARGRSCGDTHSRDLGAAGRQTALRTQGEAGHLDLHARVASATSKASIRSRAITKYGGKTIAETPHKDVLTAPFVKENLKAFMAGNTRHLRMNLFPLQVGYRKRGQSGIEVSDWWPHVGSCVDDLSVIRSMWTTDNDH